MGFALALYRPDSSIPARMGPYGICDCCCCAEYKAGADERERRRRRREQQQQRQTSGSRSPSPASEDEGDCPFDDLFPRMMHRIEEARARERDGNTGPAREESVLDRAHRLLGGRARASDPIESSTNDPAHRRTSDSSERRPSDRPVFTASSMDFFPSQRSDLLGPSRVTQAQSSDQTPRTRSRDRYRSRSRCGNRNWRGRNSDERVSHWEPMNFRDLIDGVAILGGRQPHSSTIIFGQTPSTSNPSSRPRSSFYLFFCL